MTPFAPTCYATHDDSADAHFAPSSPVGAASAAMTAGHSDIHSRAPFAAEAAPTGAARNDEHYVIHMRD